MGFFIFLGVFILFFGWGGLGLGFSFIIVIRRDISRDGNEDRRDGDYGF